MKSLYYFLRFTLVVVSVCIVHVTALAYDFVVDGIAYNVLDNEVEVTSNIPYQFGPNYGGMNIVNIPSAVTYDGKTYAVTAIGSDAFNRSMVKVVHMPNTIKVIGDAAFADCGITSIEIPNSVTRICTHAFANGLVYAGAPLSSKSPTFNENFCRDLRGIALAYGTHIDRCLWVRNSHRAGILINFEKVQTHVKAGSFKLIRRW